ncbi:MAG: hypothetical protein WCQ50_17170, partial [Spirochaetota bacterium]
MAAFVEVAFDIPLAGTFTYRNLAGDKAAGLGLRVAAPFGRRELSGYVVGEHDSCDLPGAQVKTISRRIDSEAQDSGEIVHRGPRPRPPGPP